MRTTSNQRFFASNLKLTVLSFTALSLTVAACNFQSSSKSQAPLPEGHSENQPATPWKLTLKSKCVAPAEECVAAYGFSVYGDGYYQVGPGPEGQQISGHLNDAEFKSIEDSLLKVLKAAEIAGNSGELCKEDPEVANRNDSVTYSKKENDDLLLQSESGELCSRKAGVDETKSLHTALSATAERYYLLPFPNVCTDAAAKVRAQYESLMKCSKDDDCAYVNDDYSPVPKGALQYVTVDNCSVVRPLIVGNITAVFNAQEQLRALLTDARTACGLNIVRSECTGLSGFQSNVGNPVCKAGKCSTAPESGF